MLGALMNSSKIVSDGGERLRRAKGYSEMRNRMLVEVAHRSGPDRKHASFWRRMVIYLKNRREVRALLNKEFPPAALYLVSRR